MATSETKQLAEREGSVSATATDFSHETVEEISGELRRVLADVFALYVKTKNFHWHMSGRHFRDDHPAAG